MKKLPTVPKNLTEVIAERLFFVESPGVRRRFRIQIGAPIQDVPTVSGFDWRCPIRFTGHPARRRSAQGFGVDSLQSLVHALKIIETELASIARTAETRLLWLDEHWHGFPRIELASPIPDVA